LELFSLVEPNILHQSVCFTRKWDFTWRVSDCDELVGGTNLVKSDAFPIYHSPWKNSVSHRLCEFYC